MKFSEKWLRTWVNPQINSNELVEAITMAGLEVDAVEPAAGEFSGVVVGRVESVSAHPDADKLRVCRVFDGAETADVVCGAPNVEAGMKVPFATPGARLPNGIEVSRAQVRGVDSSGMLCAEAELGISDDQSGLMVLPEDAPEGKGLAEYLGLDDRIIDVDLTPNRSDCLSIRGIARELGAITERRFDDLEPETVTPVHSEIPSIRVDAPHACPRYVGRIIRNVNLNVASPLWLTERLRRSGIRSIDPVVDVTNYVMLELGQPMHAFDRRQVSGGIVVRMAKEGEQLTLLDGQEVKLSSDTLVIADHQRPIAMAGIMGGELSGVSPDTRDIVLESAFFDPVTISGKARSHGLHTDSSHRFERGVDWQLQRAATERATALLMEIVGGEPGEVIEVSSTDNLPRRETVHLREHRVADVLGMHIDRTRIEEILTRLGLHIEKLHKDGWQVQVPSFRFDIAIEVDLIEEIARIHGYNRLPVTQPEGPLTLFAGPEARRPVSRVRDHLVALDYQEAITYSFVDPQLQQQVDPDSEAIELANPIASDMAVMRTSLWPGLLQTLSYNQKRQQSRVRLFETGLRFQRVDGEIHQESMLAGLIAGSRAPESWVNGGEGVDFYDLKGDVESLAAMLGVTLEFAPDRHPGLHPGQCARILCEGKNVGWLGTLHPQLQKMLDLNGATVIFELSLESVLTGYVPHFKEFSKYPEVRRDLAILVKQKVAWSDIREVVRKAAGESLTGLRVFDVYQGQHVEKDQKSVALSLYWQRADRTMSDEEVQSLFDGVAEALYQQLGARLRS